MKTYYFYFKDHSGAQMYAGLSAIDLDDVWDKLRETYSDAWDIKEA